jgi:hypothetical protein
MEQKILVYIDDNIITLMERMSFHLMELGIKVEVLQANDEVILYRMRHAELLPPDEDAKDT